jgi:predicted methyltransferase
MKNTTHVMRQWDDPLPPEAKDLDAVYSVAIYHDAVGEKGDMAKLNQAVFAALKPGGAYVVIDNSGKDGSGTSDCENLHRIDEKTVREQVTQAGFKLAAEGDFLRNPSDTRDWNADPGHDPRSHTQDLFALKFVKP